jgi:arylsulfatase A-like enzyme
MALEIKNVLIFLVSAVLFISSSCKEPQENVLPNVILIYADDLGRGLLETYGQEIIQTPNIDRLATGGIRFDNAYGGMYCAPARASLITGMHDCHEDQWSLSRPGIYKKLGTEFSLDEIKNKINKVSKPAREEEVFLGQVAQKVNYTTAQFGKLEWGFATTPERMKRHGWDHHFGYYDHVGCHGFYPPFLFENGKQINIPGNIRVDCGKNAEFDSPENYKDRWDMDGKSVYSQNIIMDKLLGFMDKHNPNKKKKPFFIYFPTQLPHGPTTIPKVHSMFVDNPKLTQLEKEYASMVKMLDDDVGRIYAKCEELGILDNTIIIFTSDNGHEIYYPQKGRTSKGNINVKGEKYDNIKTRYNSEVAGDIFDGNDGMSGLKRSNWEGGTRVPLFWYWKGRIQPNQVSSQMVSNYDFLNTLSEIVSIGEVQGKDGVSYAKSLFGQKSQLREYTIYASKMGPAIVTQDGWKLRYVLATDIFQLYYLPEDYAEEIVLNEQHPDKVKQLKSILLKECEGDFSNGGFPKFVQPEQI